MPEAAKASNHPKRHILEEQFLCCQNAVDQTSVNGPQVTCAHQKESLAPKINCLDLNKQPFRLETGGEWNFRGGDRGLGTYT